jgi:hypothetical protein
MRRMFRRESIKLGISVVVGMAVAMLLDGVPLVASLGLLAISVLARLILKGRTEGEETERSAGKP